MDKWNQELIDVLTRSRNVRQSKAAAMQPAKEMITICKKEYEDLKDQKCANVIKQVVRKSMAASLQTSGKGINQAQVIHNFIFNKH
jgi:DNA invertase Pin-like site-specific DNA recombinase